MHCTLITLDTPVLCFWCRPKTNTCLHRCSYLLSSSNNSWYRYRYSAQSRPKVSVSEVSVNYDIFFVSHVTWRNVLSGYFSVSVALVLVFFLVGITLLLTSVACNSTTFHTEHCQVVLPVDWHAAQIPSSISDCLTVCLLYCTERQVVVKVVLTRHHYVGDVATG